MAPHVRTTLIASLFLWLPTACTQAGEPRHKHSMPANVPPAVACDAVKDKHCAPSGTTTRMPLAPAVPPVPGSPLRIDCERLPTQVERDTCTNRKQSTG